MSVIALGDSLTYGYPFGNKYSWVSLVSEKLGTPIRNAGVNGDTFWGMLQRLPSDVIDLNPTHVVLLGGVNDLFQQAELEIIENRVIQILKKLKTQKIKPILCLPPPVQDKTLEQFMMGLRKKLRALIRKHELPSINFYNSFLNGRKQPKPNLFEDEVHPSTEGYQLMAELAFVVLSKLI